MIYIVSRRFFLSSVTQAVWRQKSFGKVVAGRADPTWCMRNAGLVAMDLARFVLDQNGASFTGQFASV